MDSPATFSDEVIKVNRRKATTARLCFCFVVLTLLSAAVLAAAAGLASGQDTALDRYIAKPDPSYSWKLVSTIVGEGYHGYVIDLSSQTWRTAADVDRPVWKHWLTIVKPDKTTSNKALLFIGGGNNIDPAPSKISDRTINFALESNTVVAELGQVPNQPLFFSDSKDKGRYEDDLVAYSRVRQMKSGDDTWLVRLAMVKSGVRALDAVQEFLASDAGGKLKIDQFVVSGGSKRGWTTWLVAAVDNRVIAIMPTVIDALNSEAITRHHFEAYGFFSPALQDYVNHKLFPDKIGTSEYQHILAIEDPYNYRTRDRLKIPKYLVNASGDQFFLPDNSQFYLGDLQGEKYMRYVPNAKHNLAGSDARDSLLAFYQAVLGGKPRPQFSWKKEKDGSLTVTVKDRPREVNLWQATNPNARDFRVDTIGNAYTSTPLKEERPGVYLGRVSKPASGFTAFFVELVYNSGGKHPFKFTTEVSVVPDVLPFNFKNAAGPTQSAAP
ncbi:MAG TPA: PhoPQ-activated pathogenicity-related family protein [Blastocatellia bacterium]|nr:PhoPQ-activated pathogenicity-related family protein [Blastocatellia bacterium]